MMLYTRLLTFNSGGFDLIYRYGRFSNSYSGGCPRIAGLFDEETGIFRPIYCNRTTAWMQELAGAVAG